MTLRLEITDLGNGYITVKQTKGKNRWRAMWGPGQIKAAVRNARVCCESRKKKYPDPDCDCTCCQVARATQTDKVVSW